MKHCQVFSYLSGQWENFQNFFSKGKGTKKFPRHLQWAFMVMNCFKNASLGGGGQGGRGEAKTYGEGIDI